MNLVLFFHAVDNFDWFEKTIIVLKKKFQMINIHQLNQFYKGELKLSQTCHITVDDGDLSFYNTIFPILKKHNVPATLFVSPTICRDSSNFWFQDLEYLNEEILIKQIEKNRVMPINFIKNISDAKFTLKCLPINKILGIVHKTMSLQEITSPPRNINLSQLLEIAENDLIEIGAHTLNHPILSNENDESSAFEISESIRLLESYLGKKIRFFALPNGSPNIDFGTREIEILKENHIELGFSTEPKILSLNDNKLCIPRFSISYGTPTFINMKLFLFKYWDCITPFWHPEIKNRKKFRKLVNANYKTVKIEK